MRGSRLGLVALISVGLLSALSPSTSANGIPIIAPHLIAAPILIVIINYPVNGLLLYLVVRRGLNRGPVPRTWTEGRFLTDFGGSVLQFTLFGAIIDTAVFSNLNLDVVGYHGLFVMALGIVGIAVTCVLVCHRYLWLEPHHILMAVAIVCSVNALGWLYVFGIFLQVFLLIELPLITLLWVVLIWRMTMRAERLAQPMVECGDGTLAAQAGQPSSTAPIFRPPASRRDISNRRTELWLSNAVLFAVCVLLSLGLEVV